MNTLWYKNAYIIKGGIGRYFAAHKRYIIIFLLVVSFALLTGIFTGIKAYGVLKIENISDFALIKLFKREISVFVFLIYRLLICSAIIIVVCLFGRNRFCSLFIYPVIAYIAFSLGQNCTIFIMVFGLGGIINVVLAIFPAQMLFLALYVICASASLTRCAAIKRFGSYTCRFNFVREVLCYFVPILIVTIIQSVLLYFCCSTFILII